MIRYGIRDPQARSGAGALWWFDERHGGWDWFFEGTRPPTYETAERARQVAIEFDLKNYAISEVETSVPDEPAK